MKKKTYKPIVSLFAENGSVETAHAFSLMILLVARQVDDLPVGRGRARMEASLTVTCPP
jgi:hypothetical protein